MGLQTCNVRHRRIPYSAPHCSPRRPTIRSSPTAVSTPTCWSVRAPENAAPTENGPAQRPNAKVSTSKQNDISFSRTQLFFFFFHWQFLLAFCSCWQQKKKKSQLYLMRFMYRKKFFSLNSLILTKETERKSLFDTNFPSKLNSQSFFSLWHSEFIAEL